MTEALDMIAMADEELHPDLVPYLQRWDDNGLLILRHPLVVDLAPVPGLVNRRYEAKCEAVRKATAAGDWERVLRLYERPWRLHLVCLWSDSGVTTQEEHAPLLKAAWTDAETPHRVGKMRLVRAFRRAGYLTDTNVAQPEHDLAIYRGGQDRLGLSWTGEPSRAEWFADRWGHGAPIWMARITPRGVLAIFIARGESEVVVNYRMLKNVEAIRGDLVNQRGPGMGSDE